MEHRTRGWRNLTGDYDNPLLDAMTAQLDRTHTLERCRMLIVEALRDMPWEGRSLKIEFSFEHHGDHLAFDTHVGLQRER